MKNDREVNQGNFCPETGLSRQKLIQKIATLQGALQTVAIFGDDAISRGNIQELPGTIKATIKYFGGVEKVDTWLRENDPDHEVVSDYFELGVIKREDICAE